LTKIGPLYELPNETVIPLGKNAAASEFSPEMRRRSRAYLLAASPLPAPPSGAIMKRP
jgi:hypothetical protein